MVEKIHRYCQKIIEYSFYALFALVPLVLSRDTSELFELNKMWVAWALTILIGGAWFTKMILQRRIFIQRTPLDIPIVLFLTSQIVSTIFSLDPYLSLWGYYSRFNGGLYSTLAYVFLYYAFVSNATDQGITSADEARQAPGAKQFLRRFLFVNLITGAIVALWGFPSHYGYDFTCLLFRGELNVSCWTESFQPTIRIFSTLGQPAWLAAYLATLLPVTLAASIYAALEGGIYYKHVKLNKHLLFALSALLLAILFYADLLFTNTRGGFLAFWAGNVIFWTILFMKKMFSRQSFIRAAVTVNAIFLLLTFLLGGPLGPLSKFTYPELANSFTSQKATTSSPAPEAAPAAGGTESGKIRLIVWQGAIDAWKANPLIGTGVETFAFAYYQHRPVAHNMTSEWDFLYNKAHNEYLNYLTTTGIFGLGSYLLFIGMFLWVCWQIVVGRRLNDVIENREESKRIKILILGLAAGCITILVSNFFGFSVVIMNLYLFIIPAAVLVLSNILRQEKIFTLPFSKSKSTFTEKLSIPQWILLFIVTLITTSMLLALTRYWFADKAYALGSSYQASGQYQEAHTELIQAVSLRPTEMLFQDELSQNYAALATAFFLTEDASTAATITQQAIDINNLVLAKHPNSISFWKSRVRLFYTLSQIDERFYKDALEAMEKVVTLAPTDAKVLYNLGILYGQNDMTDKAITTLEKAIDVKPDYRDAYYALALFYEDKAENGNADKEQYRKKAIDTMRYIVDNLDHNDEEAKKTLKTWESK